MLRHALKVLSFASLLLFSSTSWAIPAFARNTGLGCPACHDAWPRLNDFGELYRDRGYRVSPSQEALWTQLFDSPSRRYTTLMTGLDGTPMGSFAEVASPEEAWDLTHFVLSLRR